MEQRILVIDSELESFKAACQELVIDIVSIDTDKDGITWATIPRTSPSSLVTLGATMMLNVLSKRPASLAS